MSVKPNEENLKRFKQSKNGIDYWHTADFFPVSPELESILSKTHETYLDLIMELEDDEENDKTNFKLGKLIVKAAKQAGVPSKQYLEEFDNFMKIIWTPICIWYKDDSGKINYSLRSSLTEIEKQVEL